eukprot:904904_1
MAEEMEHKNGLIEWRVTGHLLQQFKDAKNKQSFTSPQFKTIDGTSWRIQIYPHGKKSHHHLLRKWIGLMVITDIHLHITELNMGVTMHSLWKKW